MQIKPWLKLGHLDYPAKNFYCGLRIARLDRQIRAIEGCPWFVCECLRSDIHEMRQRIVREQRVSDLREVLL
ncbi:MAG: hypothetical protein WCA11_09350 [Terracidiphilus sp.]